MGMVQYRTLVLHQFPFFSGRIFGSRHNNAQKPWNIDRKNYYQYNMIQDEEAENEQRGMNASLGIYEFNWQNFNGFLNGFLF